MSCDVGQYCMTPGLNHTEGPCAAGYYCLGGASSPTPTDNITGGLCPQGKYCLAGILNNGNCVIEFTCMCSRH